MVDFGDLANKAKDALGEHGDKVEQGIEKASDLAKDKLGEDKAGMIDNVADKAQGFIQGQDDQR